MELHEKVMIIAKIAKEQPNIGKTAMMKCLYLLQTIEKVPLDYSFEIYSYGPYSSDVMSEIDYASQNGYIDVSSIIYPTGQYGYNITCGAKGETPPFEAESMVVEYQTQIDNIVHTFAGKTAKELELLSTIIYTACMYKKNDWNMSQTEICESVKEIKPQFPLDEIEEKYNFLLDNHHLDKALQMH